MMSESARQLKFALMSMPQDAALSSMYLCPMRPGKPAHCYEDAHSSYRTWAFVLCCVMGCLGENGTFRLRALLASELRAIQRSILWSTEPRPLPRSSRFMWLNIRGSYTFKRCACKLEQTNVYGCRNSSALIARISLSRCFIQLRYA